LSKSNASSIQHLGDQELALFAAHGSYTSHLEELSLWLFSRQFLGTLPVKDDLNKPNGSYIFQTKRCYRTTS
jgi:hypothetical protein